MPRRGEVRFSAGESAYRSGDEMSRGVAGAGWLARGHSTNDMKGDE